MVRGGAVVALAIWLGAVLAALSVQGAPPAVAAQDEPRVEVLAERVVRQDNGATCRLHAQGVLVNRGPGPAGDIGLTLRATRATDGVLLGEGYGFSWLGVLVEGESGPFAATTSPFSCDESVGAAAIEVTAAPASAERYRRLTVVNTVTREIDGETVLFGELVNSGPAFLNAGDVETRIYVAFWLGDALVDIRAASLPVFHIPGAIGQPHPPGFRYPWSVHAPAAAFDRTAAWSKARVYPDGVYPVPLGLRDLRVSVDEPGLQLAGTIYNCGSEAADDIVVMLVARDRSGAVLQFAITALDVAKALAPGQDGQIVIGWPTARIDVEPGLVAAYPLAVQTQGRHPGLVPCDRRWGSIMLPALGRYP